MTAAKVVDHVGEAEVVGGEPAVADEVVVEVESGAAGGWGYVEDIGEEAGVDRAGQTIRPIRPWPGAPGQEGAQKLKFLQAYIY